MSKKCTVCKEDKSLDEFYNKKTSPDGKGYRCKVCDNLARKKWVDSNPDKARRSARCKSWKYNYGIDEQDYNRILTEQGGKCKICEVNHNKPHNYFAVDHCHITNKVRGLLCNRCNRSIGLLKEDISILQSAIKYLSKKD